MSFNVSVGEAKAAVDVSSTKRPNISTVPDIDCQGHRECRPLLSKTEIETALVYWHRRVVGVMRDRFFNLCLVCAVSQGSGTLNPSGKDAVKSANTSAVSLGW